MAPRDTQHVTPQQESMAASVIGANHLRGNASHTPGLTHTSATTEASAPHIELGKEHQPSLRHDGVQLSLHRKHGALVHLVFDVHHAELASCLELLLPCPCTCVQGIQKGAKLVVEAAPSACRF